MRFIPWRGAVRPGVVDRGQFGGANVLPWDATGTVGAEQLARLDTLLARLDEGPRILVTHYPIRLADGRRENRIHKLRDLDALVEVAKRHNIGLWLHGHRHHPYEHIATSEIPFVHICAGSATQRLVWSYRVYTLDGHRLTASKRDYDALSGRFHEAGQLEMRLRES